MPSLHDPTLVATLLDVARAAARAGARNLETAFFSEFSVSTKTERGDIVTDADVSTERIIREEIWRHRPDDLIAGEELPDSTGVDAHYRWSIDPLDGTSNFARGLPHFCSSVAVQSLRDGSWLAGTVTAPLLGSEYFASLGAGAFVSTARGERQLEGPPLQHSTRLFGTGFSYSEEMRAHQYAQLPEFMAEFTDVRSFGSAALGLCLTAEGSIDAFVETDLFEFDWAAGALIAEEAGLTVTRPPSLRGAIYAYPRRAHSVESTRNSVIHMGDATHSE